MVRVGQAVSRGFTEPIEGTGLSVRQFGIRTQVGLEEMARRA